MRTTFRELRSYRPCKDGWAMLCNNIIGTDFPEDPENWNECQLTKKQLDTEVSILQILESNGVEHAFWAFRTQEYRDYCLILSDIAESVLHIWEEKYPGDSRPRDVIETIRQWHAGKATDEELKAAAASAYAVSAAGASSADYAAAVASAASAASAAS